MGLTTYLLIVAKSNLYFLSAIAPYSGFGLRSRSPTTLRGFWVTLREGEAYVPQPSLKAEMDWATVQQGLPGYPTRFDFRIPLPASLEQPWTPLPYSQWIPIQSALT